MLEGFPPLYGEQDIANHNGLLSGMAALWTLVGSEIIFCILKKCSDSDSSIYIITARKIGLKSCDQTHISVRQWLEDLITSGPL